MSEEATTPTTPTTPTPAGPFEGYLQPDGTFRPNWADNLPEEVREAGATLKNFDSFPKVAGELHRLTRALEGAVKVPGEKSTTEEIATFRKAIGAAEKPEEYGLPDDAKSIAAWATEHGIPKGAVAKLAEIRKAESEAVTKAAADEEAAFVKMNQEDLVRAWGNDAQKNGTQAAALAKHFGVNLSEYVDAPLAKMVFEFSKWCQEDPNMLTGKGIPSSLFQLVAPNSKSQAEDIMTNPQNPKHAAYRRGERAVIQEVAAMLQRG